MKWLLKFKEETYSQRNSKKKQPNEVKRLKNLELFSLFYFVLISFSLIQLGFNIPMKRKEGTPFPMQSYSNEITIKLEGIGEQYILGQNFSLCPDSIILNGQSITVKEFNCSFIDIPDTAPPISTIQLIWNEKIYSLHGMFENLSNLVEVDLSKFDSSLVRHMTQMFWNCISLTSINFQNFNTSLVEDMHLLFQE